MSADAICFTVPGLARGKGRPKFVRATGRTYTDDKTASYENLVRLSAVEAMAGRPPIAGPVDLSITIRVRPPASASKRAQAQMLSNSILPTKKPDCDNVVKAIQDGCNGIVYADDVQAVDGSWRKRYAAAPGVDVIITPIASGGPV